MPGYVQPKPYGQGPSGLDLNTILQFIALQNQQEQAQGSEKAPDASGLISALGGGGAGGAAVSTGASAGTGAATYGGLSASTPVASSVGGGTVLADGSVTSAGLPEISSLAAYAPPVAAAVGTILGGRSALKMLGGKQKGWKDASLADNAGRATLAIATGGLSEVGNKLFGNHKSTKQRQNETWNNLSKEGKVPEWFMKQGVTQDQGIDDNKLASGKLGGRDVWASSAFFNKFSKPNQTWDRTGTEQQREQVANEILSNKLLDTRKGVTRFTDENAVQAIYDKVFGNKTQAPFMPQAQVKPENAPTDQSKIKLIKGVLR